MLCFGLAACAVAFVACGENTRSDSSSSDVERNENADLNNDAGSTERAGSATGNTGHGKGTDASSRPISGMSGSPTGSPQSDAADK